MQFFADAPLKRVNKGKKGKNVKKPAVVQPQPTVIDSSYDSLADIIDVEEEVTIESPLPKNKSGASVEMSAAEKLKSQTQLNTSPPKNATPTSAKNAKKKKQRRDSGTSSEEERWLDAIESGKLEEVDDELKKIKDPKLMTARQRAMYDRNMDNKETSPGGEQLLALPSGYKEKVMTAEAIQKAQLKSQKRKQMADEKREKDKKKTMDRLLKKQETKTTKANKKASTKVALPMISYLDSAKEDGPVLRFPLNVEFPLPLQTSVEPPKPILCAICSQVKRYNCSKTNIPLCSYKCYKINVESLKQIIC